MKEKFYKLTFENGITDAILCLDAVLPGKEFFTMFAGVPVIAADGASIKLHEKSIIPDFIIGDLDTLMNNPLSGEIMRKSEVIHLPDQETNDFQKSLSFCLSKNLKNILIVGLHGGALEHTLNNWSIIKKNSRDLNLCIYDEDRYGIPVYFSFRFNPYKDEIVSIIPQPSVKLTTTGLQWELKNETLGLGAREGARNRAVAEAVDISLLEGEFILFIDRRLPGFPSFKILDK